VQAGKSIAFEWSDAHTTGDVKLEVEKKLFIPADLQLLMVDNDDILEDGKTLKAQGLKPTEQVHVHISIPGLPIFVQCDDKRKTVMARSVDAKSPISKALPAPPFLLVFRY
jgi:hypothetical protein